MIVKDGEDTVVYHMVELPKAYIYGEESVNYKICQSMELIA